MQSIANQDRFVNRERTDNAEFEKYAGMLLSLGLVSTVETPEGMTYEITEFGSRFLEEYQDIEHGRHRGLEIEPDRIISPLLGIALRLSYLH